MAILNSKGRKYSQLREWYGSEGEESWSGKGLEESRREVREWCGREGKKRVWEGEEGV